MNIIHSSPAAKLITITEHEGHRAVSGRDLHQFLEVETPYAKWFARMAEYGFVDGEDFQTFLSESTGGRQSTQHALTLDMAKELSMIQRTARGKEARQYFIDVEKRSKAQVLAVESPAELMARALIAAQDTLTAQRLELEAAKPLIARAMTYETHAKSIGRQMFAREVCTWANDHKGAAMKQSTVTEFLARKLHLFVTGKRSDNGHATADAIRRGLAETAKGTADNGHNYATGKLTAAGQTYAWKRIIAYFEEHGTLVLPQEVAHAA